MQTEPSLSLSVFLAWSEFWKLLVKLQNHCPLIELLIVAACQIVFLQIEEACFEYLGLVYSMLLRPALGPALPSLLIFS